MLGEKDKVLVLIRPESEAAEILRSLATDAQVSRVLLSERGSAWLANAVPEHKRVFQSSLPFGSILLSVGQELEVPRMKRACENDGVVFAVLSEWLEKLLNAPDNPVVSELDVVAKLEEIRSTLFDEEYVTSSFPTMAASGPNAAIPYYRPTIESNRRLNRSEIFLIGAGSHYRFGTTAMARTMWLDNNSNTGKQSGSLEDLAFIKRAYTELHLRYIQVARSVKPSGSKINNIDIFKSNPLWRYGVSQLIFKL